ncbi:hypothetical protein BB560_003136 [Smittium megazygosporum]|uniref:Nucleotide exchange factor Fes1 domain-containing protein n=1 Tax=Smittium megazygosporum TaxID=133381 RepID=A0A2T9ZCV1_9FUNG|nr:hypothetical protein BB560_003136 [Smittium megazygosporum]
MEKLLQWAVINSKTEKDAPQSENPASTQDLDPAVIDAILGKPVSEQMLEIMDYLENPDSPLEGKINELDNLEMLVEQIDDAANIEPLKMWPRILNLLSSEHDEIKINTLWVIATALQHNPAAQKAFCSHNGLEKILGCMNSSNNDGVKAKAIYAISALIRGNLEGFSQFVKYDGISILLQNISNQALSKRVVFLLLSLVSEANDETATAEFRPPPSFPIALLEAGVVQKVAENIECNISQGESSIELVENTLLLILNLSKSCKKASYSPPPFSKTSPELSSKLIKSFPNLQKEIPDTVITKEDWECITSMVN